MYESTRIFHDFKPKVIEWQEMIRFPGHHQNSNAIKPDTYHASPADIKCLYTLNLLGHKQYLSLQK